MLVIDRNSVFWVFLTNEFFFYYSHNLLIKSFNLRRITTLVFVACNIFSFYQKMNSISYFKQEKNIVQKVILVLYHCIKDEII